MVSPAPLKRARLICARWARAELLFPSPLVGEGAERRSREAGEGDGLTAKSCPLTRLIFASLNFATLSHKGREGKKARDISRNGSRSD